MAEKSIPEFAQRLEKFLVATSEGPFVLGHDITIADLRVGQQVKYLSSGILDHIPKEILAAELAASFREQDPEKKKAMRIVIAQKTLPEFAAHLEKFLVATSEGPFLLGQDISIADLRMAQQVKHISSGVLDHIPKDILASYSRLNKLHQAVYDHAKVKEFYANKAAAAKQ